MKTNLKLQLAFSTVAFIFLTTTSALAQNAEQLLNNDIMATSKRFEKSFSLYHYFNAPTENSAQGERLISYLDSKSNRDTWVHSLLGVRAGTFWDLNFNSTDYVNAGAGMYLALDPASSKEFGNSAIILTAPAGATYISVFKPFALKKETIAALISENIITQAQVSSGSNSLALKNGFSRYTLKNMLRPENLKFRQLVLNIFKTNNIQYVEYEYKSFLAGFCKVANQSAFIYVGAAPESDKTPISSKVDMIHFGKALLYSTLPRAVLVNDEAQVLNTTQKFKEALEQIRIQGTKNAKKIITEKLSEVEINDLVNTSYKCERRN